MIELEVGPVRPLVVEAAVGRAEAEDDVVVGPSGMLSVSTTLCNAEGETDPPYTQPEPSGIEGP
jgi:hypothetical protein